MNDKILMTYDQWTELFKKRLKRYIKNKLSDLVIIVAMQFPLIAIIYWVIVGY